ncbi:hypothetical protein LTS14_003547 [Recurvomyces mirabilis]|uniref:uncharacterized protein n=1 Tax=Recurvomyces mirabilis TaxID=574656 RepID=UPI002DE0A711|nr:hypothetical protein LTS14_003547 [Recurvomyces mirabilis]
MERHRAAARAQARRERDAEIRTNVPSDFDLDARTERARTLDVLEGAPRTGTSRLLTTYSQNPTTMRDHDRAGAEIEDEFDATGLDLESFTSSRLDSGHAVMTDKRNGRVITSNVDGTEAHMLTMGKDGGCWGDVRGDYNEVACAA